MPDVMQAYTFDFPILGTTFHFVFKEMFGVGENPVMLVKAIEPFCIAFQFVS